VPGNGQAPGDGTTRQANASAARHSATTVPDVTTVLDKDEPFPESVAPDAVFRFDVRGIALELPRVLLTPELWRAFTHQYYEGSELAALHAAIRPNDTILEVGAGVGYISTYLLKKLHAARVVAVEADPRLIPVIHRNHAINGVAADVLNFVAARHDGTVIFNEQASFWASSVVHLPDSRQVTLPARDLSALIREIRPDVLVVDIEGGERALFDGLSLPTIRNLIVEVHRPQIGFAGIAACIEHLARAGFTYDPDRSGGSNIVFSRI
jgi:FkbM family methyltransferase